MKQLHREQCDIYAELIKSSNIPNTEVYCTHAHESMASIIIYMNSKLTWDNYYKIPWKETYLLDT